MVIKNVLFVAILFLSPWAPHKKRVASRYFDDYSLFFVIIVFFKTHTQPKHKKHWHTQKPDLRDEFEHWNQTVYICMNRKKFIVQGLLFLWKKECARFCDASHFLPFFNVILTLIFETVVHITNDRNIVESLRSPMIAITLHSANYL